MGNNAERTLGLLIGGVGAASVVAAAVFGALSMVSHNASGTWCDSSTDACTSQQGVDARSTAISDGNAATVLLVTGGALLSAGVVLWLVSPSPKGSPGVALRVAGDSPGITVGGAF